MRLSTSTIFLGIWSVIAVIWGIYPYAALDWNISLDIKPIIITASLATLIYALYFLKPIYQIIALIGISFIGIELLLFIVPILFIPKYLFDFRFNRNNPSIKKWSFLTIAFLVFTIASLIFSQIHDFSPYTIVFWILIFLSQFLIFIYYSEKKFNSEQFIQLTSFTERLILVQIFVLIVQATFHRKFYPNDAWGGTFHDADKTGLFILLYLLLQFTPPLLTTKHSFVNLFTVRRILLYVVLTSLLILCDSKIKNAMVLIGVPLIAIFGIINLSFNSSLIDKRKALVLLLSSVMFIGSLFTIINLYLTKIANSTQTLNEIATQYTESTDPRLVELGVNGKYILYKRLVVHRASEDLWGWLFGEGSGKLGSRTSNMLAYDVLYKTEGQFRLPMSIKPYSSSGVKLYMADLWTKDKANFSKYVSSNLAIPFSGWIAVIGEWGLVGAVFIFMLILYFSFKLISFPSNRYNKLTSSWAIVIAIFWITLPLQMVVDTVQEKPQIMYPMLLFTAVLLSILSNHAKSENPEIK